MDTAVARARGEVLVGAVARHFWRVDPEALDRRLGRGCAPSPTGRPQTSQLTASWLNGARPTDRMLATIEPAGLASKLRHLRDQPLWRVLNETTPSEDCLHEVWACAPAALTQRITYHRRGRLFYDPIDIEGVVAACQLHSWEALLVLVTVARYGEAMEQPWIHDLAGLGAFDVAVRLVGREKVFGRSFGAFHTALQSSLWNRIDTSVLQPWQVGLAAFTFHVRLARRGEVPCVPCYYDDVLNHRSTYSADDISPTAHAPVRRRPAKRVKARAPSTAPNPVFAPLL